jgi:prepilin-type N-terminal cleavage/methylation domain-containing protein
LPKGFTLIELMVVIMILGLLAGAAAWMMTDQLAAGSRDHAVGQISAADRMARLAAAAGGGDTRLEIDLDRGRFVRLERPADGAAHAPGHPVALPDDFTIKRVMLALPSGISEVFSGRVSIEYSTEGTSCSYAIELDAADRSVWLLVSGLTGQTLVQEEAGHVETLLALLATGRVDPS